MTTKMKDFGLLLNHFFQCIMIHCNFMNAEPPLRLFDVDHQLLILSIDIQWYLACFDIISFSGLFNDWFGEKESHV